MLKLCVRYPRASSLCYVRPLRREIRELEKTLARYTNWVEREGFEIRKPRSRVVAERARSRRAAYDRDGADRIAGLLRPSLKRM